MERPKTKCTDAELFFQPKENTASVKEDKGHFIELDSQFIFLTVLLLLSLFLYSQTHFCYTQKNCIKLFALFFSFGGQSDCNLSLSWSHTFSLLDPRGFCTSTWSQTTCECVVITTLWTNHYTLSLILKRALKFIELILQSAFSDFYFMSFSEWVCS